MSRTYPDIPPPGAPLSFDAWTRQVVTQVRGRVAGVAVTRRGPRTVILRHGTRAVTIVDDAEVWWMHRADYAVTTSIPSTFDADRHDAHTAHIAVLNATLFFVG